MFVCIRGVGGYLGTLLPQSRVILTHQDRPSTRIFMTVAFEKRYTFNCLIVYQHNTGELLTLFTYLLFLILQNNLDINY